MKHQDPHKLNPFEPLDNDEKELMASLTKGEWHSVSNFKKTMTEHARFFHASQRKNKHVNIRMTESDLNSVRARALQEGVPYQTLISSVVHKYITGYLVQR